MCYHLIKLCKGRPFYFTRVTSQISFCLVVVVLEVVVESSFVLRYLSPELLTTLGKCLLVDGKHLEVLALYGRALEALNTDAGTFSVLPGPDTRG